MNVEAQNNQEVIKQPSMEAVNDIVNKLPESEAKKAGDFIKNNGYDKVKNEATKATEAGKTNTEKVDNSESKKMQELSEAYNNWDKEAGKAIDDYIMRRWYPEPDSFA